MKMVSAAKYAKAEKELKAVRTYGIASNGQYYVNFTFVQNKIQTIFIVIFKAFYEKVDLNLEGENRKKHLIIAATSDRGLCGAVHSSIVKQIKVALSENKDGLDTKIVCIGDKSKSMLQRLYAKNIMLSVNDVGKKAITFGDAAGIANEILISGFEFDSGDIFYNKFK